MTEEKVMTIEDVAKYLKLGRRSVYQLVKSGEIPARKILNRWRIHIDDLEKWLRPLPHRERSKK